MSTGLLVIWTLGVAAAVVLALAFYLTAIAFYLARAGLGTRSHLGKLVTALSTVRIDTRQLGPRVNAIVRALAAVRDEIVAIDRHLGRTITGANTGG